MCVQLDWKTISATVIMFSRVRHSITHVMSHIVVIRMTSRTELDMSSITYTSGKKVDFLRPIFHIHAIKKKFEGRSEIKI